MPQSEGAPARKQALESEALDIVFFDESSAILVDADDTLSTHEAFKPALAQIVVRLPDRANFEEMDSTDPPAAEADGDQSGRSLMFGRYMGQVSARIYRAWLKPRDAIGTKDGFSCAVQIFQDRQGNVREVTLQECNGTLRWQASLIEAIQSASPLPGPPDPDVFSNLVSLRFEAEAYVPGHSEDGFEPRQRMLAGTGSSGRSSVEVRLNRSAEPSKSHSSDVIELKITGTPRPAMVSPDPYTQGSPDN